MKTVRKTTFALLYDNCYCGNGSYATMEKMALEAFKYNEDMKGKYSIHSYHKETGYIGSMVVEITRNNQEITIQ